MFFSIGAKVSAMRKFDSVQVAYELFFFSTSWKIVKSFWKLKETMLRNVNIMGKQNIAF